VLDDRWDYGEERYQTYGLLDGRLVLIVWTPRDAARHVISMRSAVTERKHDTMDDWVDPDEAPEWPDEVWDPAQFSVGGKVVREATGTLTKRGRPPVGDAPKQQVTLRLPRDVIAHFKAGGVGWQTRIGEVLQRHIARSEKA
jgi:uncharacterized protein (DUF4415 family)